MGDPPSLALLPFELTTRVVELTRELLSYGINKEINTAEIGHFRSLLDDAISELQAFEKSFQSVRDVNAPKLSSCGHTLSKALSESKF